MDEIVQSAKKYGIERDCFCTLAQTKELLGDNNSVYDIFIDKFDVDTSEVDTVIYPKEKKLYSYTERNTIKRLFHNDRKSLLKEVGEWKA